MLVPPAAPETRSAIDVDHFTACIVDAGGRLTDEHHVGIRPAAQLGTTQPTLRR